MTNLRTELGKIIGKELKNRPRTGVTYYRVIGIDELTDNICGNIELQTKHLVNEINNRSNSR